MNRPKASIKFDFSGWEKAIKGTLSHVIKSTPISVMRAVSQHKRDCLDKIPRCPFRSGKLVASHEILPIQRTPHGAMGTLLIHGPYAASIHEGVSRWGTPYTYYTAGTGAHWVSSKRLMFDDNYRRIMREEILGRGIY